MAIDTRSSTCGSITHDEQIVAVAALWDVWEGGDNSLLSCTLVTTEAAPEFRPWHNRMR